MTRLTTAAELTEAFAQRIDALVDAVQRVSAQQLGLVLDRDHAADVCVWMLVANAMRFAAWVASDLPDDLQIASSLHETRDNTPHLFDIPSRNDFHAALLQRHIPGAARITQSLSDCEVRREHFKLPPLRPLAT